MPAVNSLLRLAFLFCFSAPAFAQTLPCRAAPGETSTTVYDQNDIDQLAADCPSVRTTISISPDWNGPLNLSTITSIQDGGITARGAKRLTSFIAPSLVSVSGSLRFYDCDSLITISCPSLRDMGGLEVWSPNVESIDLPKTGQSSDATIGFVGLYGTSVANFTFGLSSPQNTVLQFLQNPYLEVIDLSSVRKADRITIGHNNPNVSVILSNLTDVADIIDLSEVSDISMPMLQYLDGTLRLRNNTFEQFIMPNISIIWDSLIIQDNPSLKGVNLRNLTLIGRSLDAYDYSSGGGSPRQYGNTTGNLTVTNNPLLSRFNSNSTGLPARPTSLEDKARSSGLDNLNTVFGNVTVEGPFESVDLLWLFNVYGYFHVNSTNPTYSCADFDKRYYDSPSWAGKAMEVHSGRYTCSASAPGSTKDTAAHCCRPMGTGTKAGIGVGVALAVLGVMIGLGYWWGRRRGTWERIAERRRARREAKAHIAPPTTLAVVPKTNINGLSDPRFENRLPALVSEDPEAPPPAYGEIAPAPAPRLCADESSGTEPCSKSKI